MVEYAPDPNFKHPICRGAWALGNNCKVCERCLETHPGRAGTQDDANFVDQTFRDTERNLRQRIAELEAANQAAAECVAAMMEECARYRDGIRAALGETK